MKSRLILVIFLAALLNACGGGSKTATIVEPVVTPNPAPTVSAISPSAVSTGAAAFTLTVNGTGFVSGSIVRWNGADRSTTFVSATQLKASIPAADVANTGTAAVTVFNPTPGGGTSNAMTLTVTNVPVVSSLSPATALTGSAPFTLAVNGLNFTSQSAVRWNGGVRITSFVNSTQLSTVSFASDLLAAGTANISVEDPNGVSNSSVFTIQNHTPVISSISPGNAIAGSGAFTLTVNGSGFAPSSVILWNAAARPTTFTNSGLLTAAIPASDVAAAGAVTITVSTPNPGGGISNGQVFTTASPNPVPTLTALTPASAGAGTATLLVTLDGSNFATTAVVRLNGVARADVTSFVSSTRLVANLSANDLSSAGVLHVSVFNPPPGGGVSSELSLTLQNPAPTLTSISPQTAVAGDAPTEVNLLGSGFVAASTVQWNGQNRSFIYISSGDLRIGLSAADLAASATVPVQVVNASPAGGTSQVLNFTITPRVTNPLPTISKLADTEAPAGWAGLELDVTGSGFIASSVLRFNGAARSTEVLSSTSLRAAIPPADLAAAGIASITVENGAPGGGTSSSLPFTVRAYPPGTLGVIERASTTAEFRAGNDNSFAPSVSSSGRYVAFTSEATDLVLNDSNNTSDVFVRDTCLTAASGCVPSISRVSVDSAGGDANGSSDSPAISADGRYVAFSSLATNLAAGTNFARSEIYIRDTCAGASSCVPSTVRVTPNSGTEDSFVTSVSDDGRYIGYVVLSDAGFTLTARVLDTCIGASGACTVSVIANVDADQGRLSGNGRYLVFSSADSTLVAGDTNNRGDIFVLDTCTGALSGCSPSTTRVSLAANGDQGNDFSFLPSISRDGRFVVFSSWATNLVAGDSNIGHQVYLRDTCVGAPGGCTPATFRISVSDGGTQARSGGPSTGGATLSDDGRFVAFGSNSNALVPNDLNNTFDVFVRDTCIGAPAGCTQSTRRVSVALNGTEGEFRSESPVISGDGRFVGFDSGATTFAPATRSGNNQVYISSTGRP